MHTSSNGIYLMSVILGRYEGREYGDFSKVLGAGFLAFSWLSLLVMSCLETVMEYEFGWERRAKEKNKVKTVGVREGMTQITENPRTEWGPSSHGSGSRNLPGPVLGEHWEPLESAALHSLCMISSKPAERIHQTLRNGGFWVAGCPLVLFVQEQTSSHRTVIESCFGEGECLSHF